MEYYALFGDDALGVFTSKKIADKGFRFIENCKIRRFKNVSEAIEYSKSQYNSLQTKDKNMIFDQELVLNQFLFRREICQM